MHRRPLHPVSWRQSTNAACVYEQAYEVLSPASGCRDGMSTGTNQLGFCHHNPRPAKIIYTHKKIHTHNGYKILLKLKPVRLTGTHGSSMIKNIPLHIGCTCANVSLNVKW